jgi:alpha-beta hydrolase superfamily lysophospholipase
MATLQNVPTAGKDQPLQPSEHTLTLRDGSKLFYRAWLPEQPTDQAIVLFHRGHEHSGRWQETVESLALKDVAIFAWDARGHGRSEGERGTAPNVATLVKDADEWVRGVCAAHGIPLSNLIVVDRAWARWLPRPGCTIMRRRCAGSFWLSPPSM